MLWIFWPIGLFLLAKRLMQEMPARYRYQEGPHRAYADVPLQNVQTGAPPRRAPKTDVKEKKSIQNLMPLLLTVLGALFAAAGTISVVQTIADWISYGYLWASDLIAPLFFGCGPGFGMLFAARRLKKRQSLLKRYTAIIGNKKVLSIDELTAIESSSYKKVCRELEELLETGIFPGAYLDRSRRLLILSNEGLEENELYRQAGGEIKKPAIVYGAADETAYSEKDGYIRRIRKVNDEIADDALSQKIDRIEKLTAKMFDAVERDPDKRPQIETFLSYYLPTTLKILNAYRDFENQTARGANIASAMQDIENIMDTLVAGFEKQLDLLFADDALDITTDISVLEGMLAKDGLKEDGLSAALKR